MRVFSFKILQVILHMTVRAKQSTRLVGPVRLKTLQTEPQKRALLSWRGRHTQVAWFMRTKERTVTLSNSARNPISISIINMICLCVLCPFCGSLGFLCLFWVYNIWYIAGIWRLEFRCFCVGGNDLRWETLLEFDQSTNTSSCKWRLSATSTRGMWYQQSALLSNYFKTIA